MSSLLFISVLLWVGCSKCFDSYFLHAKLGIREINGECSSSSSSSISPSIFFNSSLSFCKISAPKLSLYIMLMPPECHFCLIEKVTEVQFLLVTIVSVKHFSCHNCFCETCLLSMYFKYVVSEKLTYCDFAYFLWSRQGAKDPQRFQVEAHGV